MAPTSPASTLSTFSPCSLCSRRPGILSIPQAHQGHSYSRDSELAFSFCLEHYFPRSFSFLAPFYSFISPLKVTNPEWLSQATRSKLTPSLSWSQPANLFIFFMALITICYYLVSFSVLRDCNLHESRNPILLILPVPRTLPGI